MSRPERHPPPTAGLTELVLSAADGDQQAWDALVDRFAGLVWSIARAHRLSATDAADVSQTTWLRLVEHLRRIRDPERVGAWLAAAARPASPRAPRPRGRPARPPPPQGVLVGDPARGPFRRRRRGRPRGRRDRPRGVGAPPRDGADGSAVASRRGAARALPRVGEPPSPAPSPAPC